MKPPNAEATREALTNLHGSGTVKTWPAKQTVEAAAQAWLRIAPDADGEWPEGVVDQLAKAGSPIEWEEGKRHIPRARARAVLAELVGLAEGSTE